MYLLSVYIIFIYINISVYPSIYLKKFLYNFLFFIIPFTLFNDKEGTIIQLSFQLVFFQPSIYIYLSVCLCISISIYSSSSLLVQMSYNMYISYSVYLINQHNYLSTLQPTGEFTKRVREMSSHLFVRRGIDRQCIQCYRKLRQHLPNPFREIPCSYLIHISTNQTGWFTN